MTSSIVTSGPGTRWSVPAPLAITAPGMSCMASRLRADQLLRRRPIEAHAALRGVHRLRDAEAERPEVSAEGDGAVPIDLGIEPGSCSASGSATTCAAASATREGRRRPCGKACGRAGGEGLERAGRGSVGRSMRGHRSLTPAAACRPRSCGQVDPAPLAPAPQPGLRQLHALGARHQVPGEARRLAGEVAQEHLPLHAEAVRVVLAVRHFLPSREEVDGLRDVGIPDWLRRVYARLGPAFLQAGDGAAMRAVHLEGRQVVAPHARHPDCY